MIIETVNRWLALITNVGVIAGLAVLIYEIKQNTLAIGNETDVAIYSLHTDLQYLIAESQEFAGILQV